MSELKICKIFDPGKGWSNGGFFKGFSTSASRPGKTWSGIGSLKNHLAQWTRAYKPIPFPYSDKAKIHIDVFECDEIGNRSLIRQEDVLVKDMVKKMLETNLKDATKRGHYWEINHISSRLETLDTLFK